MEMRKIYTENAEEEQWRIILRYAYENNIKNFLIERGVSSPSEELVENISGSILQAQEYFNASKISTLHISPLLMYYGTTNLYNAIINLTTGQINLIQNHGMQVDITTRNSERIADISVIPRNPSTGALSVFANALSNDTKLCNTGKWSILELIASIPDIYDDTISTYNDVEPFVLPVEVVKQKNMVSERIIKTDFERFNNFEEVLNRLENRKYYLRPQIQKDYVVFIRKMDFIDESLYSLTGRKYYQISHLKNGSNFTPSLDIILFMLLFSLGYICRYCPQIWNPFIRKDTSGEKLLFEKILQYARRVIPNLMINKLYGQRICFTSEEQGTIDLKSIPQEEDIRNVVQSEIKKYLIMERMKLNK